MTDSQDRSTVILVEDDDVDAMAIQRALSRELPEVCLVRATDGIEALDLIRAQSQDTTGRFIVVLDLNMPRMNGLELLRELRRDPKLSSTVVFVHTTSKDSRDLVSAYQLNIAGYLVKAFDDGAPEGFVGLVREYFRSVTFPPRSED